MNIHKIRHLTPNVKKRKKTADLALVMPLKLKDIFGIRADVRNLIHWLINFKTWNLQQ